MKNFLLTFSNIAGGGFIYDESTGEEIIQRLIGDDIRPPITHMSITAKTKDGKTIRISVSNSNDEEALIEIE